MRPFEETDDYEDRNDPSRRSPKPSWKGYIDPGYTVASAEAGKIRILVHGVRLRTMLPEAVRKALSLLMLARGQMTHAQAGQKNDEGCGWTLCFAGLEIASSRSQVDAIIEGWKLMRGHNTPSVHVFPSRRLVTLAVTSGCLMRRISSLDGSLGRTTVEHQWVDSFVFNSANQRKQLGLPKAYPQSPLEYVRTHFLLGPYMLFDSVPRPTLGTIMSSQAVCFPSANLMSIASPRHYFAPIVETPLMSALVRSQSAAPYAPVPGVPLTVLFANFMETYEDSVVLSSEVNRMRLFATTGLIYHPVPVGEKPLCVGDLISQSTHPWWRPADTGTILREGFSKHHDRLAVATMEFDSIRIGDKVATVHGQKQTVSTIIDRSRMPLCTDVVTGQKFKPHIIMASSSVHNHMTVEQVYEAWAGAEINDVSNFDPLGRYNVYTTSLDGSDGQLLRTKECNFEGIGTDQVVVKSRNGHGDNAKPEPCVADYGICTFLHLMHLVRDKQHYCSSVPRGLQAPNGRLSGSSVRLGEMELLAMMSKGMVSCVSEVLDCSDECVVDICSRCRRLSLLCDCPSPKPNCTKVVTRANLAKFDVCRLVYTASMVGTPSNLAQDHTNNLESNLPTSSDRLIPSSFTYHVQT